MKNEFDVRDKLTDEFDDLIDYSERIIENSDIDSEVIKSFEVTLEKLKTLKHSLNEPFSIAVVGAQGVGKSTFINLLLNSMEDTGEIMPSTMNENEGIIIKIKKAPDESLINKARLFDEEFEPIETFNKEEFLNLIDLEENKTFLEDNRFKDRSFIEYYPDIPSLDKFEIINTPGMNVITGDFYSKVKRIFIKADLIIWVNSGAQMLDNFNKELIGEIFKDNKKIISVLTKIDNLYEEDALNGIIDPIEQFLHEIEKNILFRHDSKICLFPYDGYRSQISYNLKENILLYEDEEIDEIVTDLEIIWNYFKYGFAFSNNNEIIKQLNNLNIINTYYELPDIPKDFPENYDKETFLKWLYDKKFIVKNSKGNIVYSKIGLSLLYELSNFEPIKLFSQEFLFSHSLKDKIQGVIERSNNLLSDDNIIGEFKVLNNKFIDFKNGKENEYNFFCDSIEESKIILKNKFYEMKTEKLKSRTSYLTIRLIDDILNGIEKKINKSDFLTEFVFKIPGSAKVFGKKSKIENKIENIITSAFEKLLDDKIPDIVTETQNFIEVTLINLKLKTEINLADKPEPVLNGQPSSIPLPSLSEIFSRVRRVIRSKANVQIIKKVKDFAKRDLRKKGNKKIKPLVKLLRNVFKKIGVKTASKTAGKAGKSATKASNPIGWILLAVDIIDAGFAFSSMLRECKNELKKLMDNQSYEFQEQIEDILEKVYDNILNETLSTLDEQISEANPEIENLLKNLEISQETINKFENAKEKINGLK